MLGSGFATPTHTITPNWSVWITFGEQQMSLSSALCEFLHPPVISSLLAPNILHRTQHHVTVIYLVCIDLQAKGLTMHCGSYGVITLSLENFGLPSAKYYTHYLFWVVDLRSKNHAINYFHLFFFQKRTVKFADIKEERPRASNCKTTDCAATSRLWFDLAGNVVGPSVWTYSQHEVKCVIGIGWATF